MLFAALLQAKVASPHVAYVSDERPIDVKLFAAIRAGDEPRVHLLLARGADPNANEANGWSPLTSLNGNGSKVLLIASDLVAKGAKVNYRQPGEGFSALQMAAMSGNASLVGFYLRHGADPNILDTQDEPPLTYGIRARSLAVVKLLLEHGARLEIRSNSKNVRLADDRGWEPGFKLSGQTPAFGLATGFDSEVATFLLKAGVNLRATDDNGWTILHHATKYGQVDAMEWLIAHGLDPNAASDRGYRPLHLVSSVGFGFPSAEVAKILMTAGANPNLKNDKGQTPLDILRETVAWMLRPSSPAVGLQPDSEAKYLALANELARVLDPNSPPISRPIVVVGQYGHPYEPKEIAEGLKMRYWVRREVDRAILRITFDPPQQDVHLKFKRLWLHSCEPMGSVPKAIDLKKGAGLSMEIAYPAVAAGGGDLDLEYEFTQGGETGSGSDSPSSRDIGFEYGSAVSIAGDEPDRTMFVRFDSVSLGGKVLKQFTGLVITLHGSKPVVTGFPPGHLDIRYEIRIPPNKTWEQHAITL